MRGLAASIIGESEQERREHPLQDGGATLNTAHSAEIAGCERVNPRAAECLPPCAARRRRTAAPCGEADGSIIAVIITAHIAQSRSRCETSQRGVIIHALAPVIGPYMSRAITTIQSQEAAGSSTSSSRIGVRLYCSADSRRVDGRLTVTDSRLKPDTTEASGAAPGEGRVLSVVLAARIVPGEPSACTWLSRGVSEREAIRGRMSGVVDDQRLGRHRG